ncbi:glycoside hydrolase family 16 protein [Puniceicoccales bacterium CK1056]|uniref:Glycoside hydrolase family 16 protein n=1 Tax=Oceanipulchritudo coccoides TaxID=2706888 RepID=A0A6B2M4V9_9BACT|nr:glycoside hydrolase family 16 protein [Oceanipulchritudo coccoides]NDV62885.1 glycoside hydrolase family 16 protein [Oceanipulchritudo coccoides]
MHAQTLYTFLSGSLLLAATTVLAVDPVLIWSDEFDVDGLPDSSKWLYDVGGSGWGNAEEQFYTEERLENARVESGVLIIEARKEGWPPSRQPTHEYTSARLLSKGYGDWLYGRIEIRAKLPAGTGTWPAIWMMPTGDAYGIWPRSGEIDIMEHVGFDMGTVHGSLHSLNNNWLTGTYPTAFTVVPDVDTTFHDYAIEWSPAGIIFTIDGTELLNAPNPGTSWEDWPFDQPFHLILNVAVGGSWGGQQGVDPDIWPQRLEVDYVRVYDLGDTVALDTDNDQDPNATDPDDDGDGLTDIEEHVLGTNILKQDTDGDGYKDLEEIEAGTSPLLAASYPGSIGLLINTDFSDGDFPWIVHTNFFDFDDVWFGQVGSWGGAYTVLDWVEPVGESEFVFYNLRWEPEQFIAEHLLFQEFKSLSLEMTPGDVIRFRGTASAIASDETFIIEAFIRVLDRSFQKMPESVEFALGPDPVSFELETSLGEDSINLLQLGLLIKGPVWETAVVTFSNLEGTINEEESWAGYPVVEGVVDTGDWLGMLYVGHRPWIWSYSLEGWMYLPVSHVGSSGAWVYVVR